MTFSNEQQQELRKKLLEVTEAGPVVEWVERIAAYARKAGGQRSLMSRIKWNQSPEGVAFEAVKMLDGHGLLPTLEQLLN